MKLRADLYRREAGELLRNISMYPGLSEAQLCRFFPGKEETIRTLLIHMVHTGRAVLSAENRYFASAEQLDQHDPNIARAVWVLLDLLPQAAFLPPPLQAALDGFCKTHPFPLYDRCVVCVEHVYDAALPHSQMRDYDNLQLKPVLDMVALYAMRDDSGSLCDLYQTSCLEFEPCTRVAVLPPGTFAHWLESHGIGAKARSENRSVLTSISPTTEKVPPVAP